MLVALFAAAVAVGPVVSGALWIGVCVALVGITLALGMRRARALGALGALALFIVGAGLTWGHARVGARSATPVALSANVSGLVVVDAPPVRHGVTQRAVAIVERLGLVRAGARVLADFPDSARVHAGDRLRVTGRLSPPVRDDAPAWWRRYLERQRIAARLRVRVARSVGHRSGLTGARDRWRTWVRANTGSGASGDARALVRGMSIGATDELSTPRADDLRAAGLWHLVAVSGQNVAIVAGAFLVVLIAAGVGRRVAAGASVAVILLYCIACDGGASVARAGIMGAIGCSAIAMGSVVRRWHVLFVGLAVLLAWSPDAATDPGLQLSFAATAGLMALAGPAASGLAGWLPGPIAALVAQSLAASVATAPVLAADFGKVSLVGVVLNIVAVPLAGPIVILGLLGLFAGAAVPGVGALLAWIAGCLADALLALANVGASVPGATLSVGVLEIAVLLGAVALVGGVLWLRRRGRLRKARGAVSLAFAVILSVIAIDGCDGNAGAAWPTGPAVTALDIGQGDAILLSDANGTAILVDTGPPGADAPVLDALARHGVRRLDALIITHQQSDHDGGAAAVLEHLPVGRLIVPPLSGRSTGTDVAFADARSRGIPLDRPEVGAVIRAGAWSLRVLSPRRAPTPGEDPNHGALVVDARAGGFGVLLTADAESDVLASLPLGHVDVLKVSHHGSDDPGLGRVLDRINPTVALLSVGRNTFGHPRSSTLSQLDAHSVTTLRTDIGGDATVSAGPSGLHVSRTNRVRP